MMCTVDAAVVCRLGQVPLAAPMSYWLVRISSDHFFNELLSAFDLTAFKVLELNNKGGRFAVKIEPQEQQTSGNHIELWCIPRLRRVWSGRAGMDVRFGGFFPGGTFAGLLQDRVANVKASAMK